MMELNVGFFGRMIIRLDRNNFLLAGLTVHGTPDLHMGQMLSAAPPPPLLANSMAEQKCNMNTASISVINAYALTDLANGAQ
jgi:hypothetical protein